MEKQKKLKAEIARKYSREGPDLEFIAFQKKIAMEQAYRRATVHQGQVYMHQAAKEHMSKREKKRLDKILKV